MRADRLRRTRGFAPFPSFVEPPGERSAEDKERILNDPRVQAAQKRNQEVARKSDVASKAAPKQAQAQPTGREQTAAPADGPTEDTIEQNKKIVQQWIGNWRAASPSGKGAAQAAQSAAKGAEKAAGKAAKGAEKAAGKAAKAAKEAAPSANGSAQAVDKEKQKEIEARKSSAQSWIQQWFSQSNGSAQLHLLFGHAADCLQDQTAAKAPSICVTCINVQRLCNLQCMPMHCSFRLAVAAV